MAETKIIYKDVAPDALANVTPQISDLQPFCGLDDLKREHITAPKAATLERDYWRLDGTFDTFPDDPTGQTWGVWSKSMAGEGGVFSVPPVLTLSFTELFSSVGMTFYFNQHGPDWCRDLNAKWYRDETILADVDFLPTAWEYPCVHEVRNYNRIVVTFRAMSRPYRYLKLQSAIYGITRTFWPEEFRAVNLFQAASPISEELEINTLDFTLSSRDPVPFLFQRKQPMEVYHGESLQGVFYISRSKRTGERIYDIEANDLLGLMDESDHKGGVYVNVAFGSLVAEIMGPYPYELDQALEGVALSGWLPIATRRDNLAQGAFAAGAAADTSGSDRVRIYAAKTVATTHFDGDHVFRGSNLETAALVTAAEVTEHSYSKSTETQELFSGALDGVAEITFSEPMHTLTITGGSIQGSGAHYALISGSGDVVLTGQKYNHTTRVVQVKNPNVNAVDIANVVRVTDATLVSAGNSAAVAQRVYQHYQRRDTVHATLVLGEEKPGDVVMVQTEFDGIKTGAIQSLDVDLARKRIGEAVILCE